MIGYVTLGTNNLEQSGEFYDALLAEIGATRFMTNERMIMWGKTAGAGMLALCTPHDEQTASSGNGTMVALNVESTENVDKVYAKAIELGATDEGPAGPRGDAGGFYGGYFRDAEGNKLVAYCMG